MSDKEEPTNIIWGHGEVSEQSAAEIAEAVPSWQAARQGGEVEPVITNEMKAECIGEFSFMVDVPCGECLIEGEDEDCEVCGGELTHEKAVTVPWDTCKKIYKTMAKFDPSRATHPPVPTQGVPEEDLWEVLHEAVASMPLGIAEDDNDTPTEHIYHAIKPFIAPNHPSGEWVRCADNMPKLGQRVILKSQGVVQHYMPVLDESDEGLFWEFEQDENPLVDFENDEWIPQPPKDKQEPNS